MDMNSDMNEILDPEEGMSEVEAASECVTASETESPIPSSAEENCVLQEENATLSDEVCSDDVEMPAESGADLGATDLPAVTVSPVVRIAEVICNVFRPQTVFLILVLTLLFSEALPVKLPGRVNRYVLIMFAVNVIALPLLYWLVMNLVRRLERTSATVTYRRTLMTCVMVMGLFFTAFAFSGNSLLFVFRRSMLALGAVSLIALLASILGTDQNRSCAFGAALGVLWILTYGGYSGLLPYFSILVILASVTLGAEIELGRNTVVRSLCFVVATALISCALVLVL